LQDFLTLDEIIWSQIGVMILLGLGIAMGWAIRSVFEKRIMGV
jgi:hypothetical protein